MVGFSLFFGVLNIIHFSHGDAALMALFLALALVQTFATALGQPATPGTMLLCVALAIALTGLLGVVLDFLVIQRPACPR